MRYALYLGCVIPTEQYHYELSVRGVLPRLGVELVDLEGFSCCGVSVKGFNSSSWLFLAARNLALAEEAGLGLLPLCNGCYNSFQEARHQLNERPKVRDAVNGLLAEEGLEYGGGVEVHHLLDVLARDVDQGELEAQVKRRLEGLKVATHYGCHALRPGGLNPHLDSEDPHIMEDILGALGAESPYYPEKLDCCGSTLTAFDYEAAFKLTAAKVEAIQRRGFHAIATVCPFCQKMLDNRQEAARRSTGVEGPPVPVFYLTQLMGFAMGLEPRELGLNLNATPVDELLGRWS